MTIHYVRQTASLDERERERGKKESKNREHFMVIIIHVHFYRNHYVFLSFIPEANVHLVMD